MITILHEGDYHSGHLLGLSAPDVQCDTREALDKMWRWREAELKAICPVDIHIVNGDLVDGPGKKDSIGLITTDLDRQAAMAEACVARVRLKKGGERHFTYGSAYHVVASGNVERSIARAFDSPISDTVLIKAGGVRLNFRHFVGRSDTERGQPTQVAREITRALIQEIEAGREAADVFGRSHVHYYTRVDLADRIGYCAPAYQLPLDIPGSVYPRGLRTQYYHVGYVLIQIDNRGEVFIRPRKMRLVEAYPKEYKLYEPA